MYKKLFFIIVPIILLVGCAALSQYGKLSKSAEKNFQTNNYDIAFKECLQSLKLKPDYDKSQLLMQDIFRVVVDHHENNIKNSLSSPNKFKYDQIVSEYNTLISINDDIKTLPTLRNKKTQIEIKFETKDYSVDLADAQKLAAEAHYQEGDRLSQISTLDSQKSAAKEFKLAQEYVNGYKDSADRYQICRKAGIKRMAIIPFENKSGKSVYGAIEEMISDQIISTVMGDPSAMEFLEIISRGQLSQVMQEQQLGLSGIIDQATAIEIGRVLGVHELLTGKITQIAYTEPRTASSNFGEKNNVVVGEETYTDKDGKKKTRAVWGDVTASIQKYVKTASASINGSYNIIEVTSAKIKRSESFKGDYSFYYEWGTYRGDERALSRSSRSLCSNTETFPPGAEEMVNRAANDLSNSLSNTLIQYAK